jgi:hypothetical protein
MNFPDILHVRIAELETNLPVSGIALLVTLKALRKNDYGIGPKISDQDGKVEFTKQDCDQAIKLSQQMFVMDYAGDLSSCGSSVEISVHPPDAISRMIQQYEANPVFWGSGLIDPVGLFVALREVRNADFLPTRITVHEDELLGRSEVEIYLEKRPV